MSQGPDALGSDISLRAESRDAPTQVPERRKVRGRQRGLEVLLRGSLPWEASTLLEDRRQCLERGGGGWLWQLRSHSRHQRGGHGCGGPAPASCRPSQEGSRSESWWLRSFELHIPEHSGAAALLKLMKEETGTRATVNFGHPQVHTQTLQSPPRDKQGHCTLCEKAMWSALSYFLSSDPCCHQFQEPVILPNLHGMPVSSPRMLSLYHPLWNSYRFCFLDPKLLSCITASMKCYTLLEYGDYTYKYFVTLSFHHLEKCQNSVWC